MSCAASSDLEVEFQINSLGDANCRPAFRRRCSNGAGRISTELCEDCHQRLERNPLRLLDCKIDAKLARDRRRSSADYLCDPCRKHFGTVAGALTQRPMFPTSSIRGWCADSTIIRARPSRRSRRQSGAERGGRRWPLRRAGRGAGWRGRCRAPASRSASSGSRSRSRPSASRSKETPDAAIIAMGERARCMRRWIRQGSARRAYASSCSRRSAASKRCCAAPTRSGAHYALIVGENELARGVVQSTRSVKPARSASTPSDRGRTSEVAATRTRLTISRPPHSS